MKLPSRLALALGTLISGLVAVALEAPLPHPALVAIVLVGNFALFLIHPEEKGVLPHETPAPPWVAPATAAKPAAPTAEPAQRSLP
jgi:hypothetical protein